MDKEDYIFYTGEFTQDELLDIYLEKKLIIYSRELNEVKFGLISKKYYMYILYLLEKESNLDENKEQNRQLAMEFFKDMIEAEKIIHNVTKKEEKIFKKNCEELDERINKYLEWINSPEYKEQERKKQEKIHNTALKWIEMMKMSKKPIEEQKAALRREEEEANNS